VSEPFAVITLSLIGPVIVGAETVPEFGAM
jgi:hypothetical protein